MVIYDLECAQGHHFEGWFPNLDAFEKQKRRKMISCSLCGITEVSRIPSKPKLSSQHTHGDHGPHRDSILPTHPTAPQSVEKETKTANIDMGTLIRMANHFIKANFKNVGQNFTEQALQMHKGEMAAEKIYGDTTPEQRELLEEEGVELVVIPKIPEEMDN